MKVDVIIPTYKPDKTFCLLLQKLREQTFVVHRVIVINTEESLWYEAAEKYPVMEMLDRLLCPYTLCHIRKDTFDHAGTRMQGAMESQADIILFMTMDAVPADRYMSEHLVRALEAGDGPVPAVAYARQLPKRDCSVVERYTRRFNYPKTGRKKTKADRETLGIKTFFCSDVCAAYRRDLFLELGGFVAPAIFNEDMLFAAKAIEAGYAVVYAARAQVIHSHNYTIRQQFHRNFDLAVSQADHPEVFGGVRSESEGIKLVTATARHLCRIHRPWLIFGLVGQCAGKYAGYFLGKRYRKLSKKMILKLTSNPDYWYRLWSEADGK